jgi:hypothetical protein
MGLPYAPSTGRHRATTASSPPTSSVIAPARIASGPPLTGASITLAPRTRATPAMSSAVRGLPVVWITSVASWRSALAMPSAPSESSRTCASL